EPDAAVLNRVDVCLARLVVPSEHPLAVAEKAVPVEVVRESARERIGLGDLLKSSLGPDVLQRAEAAEWHLQSRGRGCRHRGLDAGGNERVAAVDREVAVGARARGIPEITSSARCSEFRVTGDDL